MVLGSVLRNGHQEARDLGTNKRGEKGRLFTFLNVSVTIGGIMFSPELNAVSKGTPVTRSTVVEAKGLGNPFKGKTFNQIDDMFKAKGFNTIGNDPLSGKGSYINLETGTRYYLDQGGRMYKKTGIEGPHVDIWYNGHPSYEKVKYFLDGSPKLYTPLK